MIKLTQIQGQPIFWKPEAIIAILPASFGSVVFGGGLKSEVKESALSIYQMISRAERQEAKKVRRGRPAA